MPYDQDRYRSLIARAAFDCSFYKGTIQDLSASQRPMSFVGSPSFGKCNGLPCLMQNADVNGATSAAVARVVDVSQPCAFEVLATALVNNTAYAFRQRPATGGFTFAIDNTNRRLVVILYDAAGAAARWAAPTWAGVTCVREYSPTHYLVSFGAGGLTAASWFNGVPVAATAGGAGIPANGADTAVVVGNNNTGLIHVVERAYPFALTNEEVQTLYQSAKLLVGGEI